MIRALRQFFCRHRSRYREVNTHTQRLDLVCHKCERRVPVAMTNVIVFPSHSRELADVAPFRKRVGQ